MKRLLIPLLAALALQTPVEANLFQKEPTYKQIVSQCKGVGSKYSEYNEIGMTQFAKNLSIQNLSPPLFSISLRCSVSLIA